MILGAPVGNEKYTREQKRIKFDTLTKYLKSLSKLALICPQTAYIIYSYSHKLKLNYIFRTNEYAHLEGSNCTKEVNDYIIKLFRTELKNETKQRISLPRKFGGLGIQLDIEYANKICYRKMSESLGAQT